jgi:formate dehydrogenase subunit gamma
MTDQPAGWNNESRQRVQQAIAQHRALDGPLLPILHAVQASLGFVPSQALADIAQALNLSRAEVYGVLTYYDHFRQQPPARMVIHVCRAEACHAMGAGALLDHACTRAGGRAGRQSPHVDSSDKALAIEPAYCLGLCAMAPAVAVESGGVVTPHARMTVARLDALIDAQVAP